MNKLSNMIKISMNFRAYKRKNQYFKLKITQSQKYSVANDHTATYFSCLDLTWYANTVEIVRKSNARMELLQKVSGCGVPEEDLKTFIYFSKEDF